MTLGMLLNFSEPQLGGEGQVTVVITNIQGYAEGLRKKSPGTMAGTQFNAQEILVPFPLPESSND